MGNRLKVDLDALADTAGELRNLADEFRRAAQTGDLARHAVGHDRVADALGTFTGNWRRHRESLVSSLDAVAKMAEESHATYTRTDSELAGQAQ